MLILKSSEYENSHRHIKIVSTERPTQMKRALFATKFAAWSSVLDVAPTLLAWLQVSGIVALSK
jgi:hypothetical protein